MKLLSQFLMLAMFSATLSFFATPLLAEEENAQGESLFNGEDLSGWETVGDALWEVTDGMLIGRQGADGEPGDLLTEAIYDDFELTVVYKIAWPGNSGIWYRYQSPEKAYQADILEYKNPLAYSGSLYCPGKLFLAMNEDPDLVNREGWNTMVIRVEGDHHVIFLNGTQIADVHDGDMSSGRIGFQVHAGEEFADMMITVKEIHLLKK